MGGGHPLYLRLPHGERAGLVEKHRGGACQLLHDDAPLEHHALARCARHARYQGDGCGEDERAGGGHHQHGQRPHRVAAHGPGDAGHHQGDGQQQCRVAVGHALERRTLGLGLFDQAHDGGVGALRRRAGGHQLECLCRIRHAASHGLAGQALHRQRLACERRLVEERRYVVHAAVHRHDLAGSHQQYVAGNHLFRRDPLQLSVGRAPHGPLGRAGHQCLEVVPGTTACGGLERVAARQHHRHHGSRQELLQRQGPGHGDQGDGIHPHVAVQQGPDDRPRERHEQRPGHDSPHGVGRDVLVGGRQAQAGHDPQQGGEGHEYLGLADPPPSGEDHPHGHQRRPREGMSSPGMTTTRWGMRDRMASVPIAYPDRIVREGHS